MGVRGGYGQPPSVSVSVFTQYQMILKDSMGVGASYYPAYYPAEIGVIVNVVFANNFIVCAPLVVPESGTLNSLLFNLAVVGGAGSLTRAGIYSAGPASAGWKPANLVAGGAEFDTSAVGGAGPKIQAINLAVNRGDILWLTLVNGVGVPAANLTTFATFGKAFGGFSAAFAWQASYVAGFAYAALPAIAPAMAFSGTPAPVVGVKYA